MECAWARGRSGVEDMLTSPWSRLRLFVCKFQTRVRQAKYAYRDPTEELADSGRKLLFG